VLGQFREIEYQRPFPRHEERVNPHNVLEDPSRRVGRMVPSGRLVACNPWAKVASACWASASQATTVRPDVWKALTFGGTLFEPMLLDRALRLGTAVLGTVDRSGAVWEA
jgi:hypothetical protein